jgi:hypothetical protein
MARPGSMEKHLADALGLAPTASRDQIAAVLAARITGRKIGLSMPLRRDNVDTVVADLKERVTQSQELLERSPYAPKPAATTFMHEVNALTAKGMAEDAAMRKVAAENADLYWQHRQASLTPLVRASRSQGRTNDSPADTQRAADQSHEAQPQ